MKFTVVVTVFEREHLVPRVLHGLASQTYSDWNAIFIEDGSYPLAKQTVKDFADKTGLKVGYRSMPHAGGKYGNAARRRGLEIADGEYVCFLGHDCLIDPDYLATHAEGIDGDHRRVSVVQCRYWATKDWKEQRNFEIETYDRVLPAADANPQHFAMGDVDLTCLAFPRKEALRYGVFEEGMQYRYDADWFSFETCRHSLPVVFTPKVVCAHF